MLTDKLESFIERHSLPVKSSTGRSFIFDCPACGGQKKLYIDKHTGQSVCFKGKSEDCPKPGTRPHIALALITGTSAEQIKKEIFGNFTFIPGNQIDPIDEDVKNNAKTEVEIAPATLPADSLPISHPKAYDGVLYLESRGVDLQQAIDLKVIYSPIMRRVIFPVIIKDKLYGWQGRAIDAVPKHLRMYNWPGSWKAHSLMFYSNLKNSKFAIIAEGAVSALKFKNVGGYVAAMGKEISDAQIKLLLDSGVEDIYLAIDRDAYYKLNDIREKILRLTLRRVRIFNIEPPSHRDDFGDCTYEECEQAFKDAKRLTGNELTVY